MIALVGAIAVVTVVAVVARHRRSATRSSFRRPDQAIAIPSVRPPEAPPAEETGELPAASPAVLPSGPIPDKEEPEPAAGQRSKTNAPPDSEPEAGGDVAGGGVAAVPEEVSSRPEEADATKEPENARPPVVEGPPSPVDQGSAETIAPPSEPPAEPPPGSAAATPLAQDRESVASAVPDVMAEEGATGKAGTADHEGAGQESGPPGPSAPGTTPAPVSVEDAEEDRAGEARTAPVADGRPATDSYTPQDADGHPQEGSSQVQEPAEDGGHADEDADSRPSRDRSTPASEGEAQQPAPADEASATAGGEEKAGAEGGDEPSGDAEETGSRTSRRTRRRPSNKSASPRQYQPPTRAPAAGSTAGGGAAGNGPPRERALRVEVRLLFEHGGFACLSLLPQRDPSLPQELPVSGDGDPPALLALQDEWYQDVVVPGISSLLRRGLVWQGAVNGQPVRWNLSGREVYVLGHHNSLNGYVSKPRLEIGEDQIVLCTEDRREASLEAIRLAGSPDPSILTGDLGMPTGWVALKGVSPKSPVPPRNDGDILEVLRPLADVEIVFDGGIRLYRTSWLVGYPPRIRLKGMAEEAGRVLIDGTEASPLPDGSLASPGWDRPGTHEVWCHSASKSYSLEPGADGWEAWNAHRWSHGVEIAPDHPRSPAICGMAVLPPEDCGGESHTIAAPAANPLLIGAEPGQIHLCAVRGDLRGAECMAFLPFEPVWALPADPWRCDKRTARIVLVRDQRARPSSGCLRGRRRKLVDEWYAAILAASRKGLMPAPADERTRRLWQCYRRLARQIWRSRR